MPTISSTIRHAMEDSGCTLYRIAKDSGVGYATVHRFYTGQRGLNVETAGRLAAYLGLELRPKDGGKVKSTKRKRTAK